MTQSVDRQSGFTVLEALVSLAILTGVTASILSLLAITRSLQNRGELRLTSTIQAESLLNRVGHDIPLKAGHRAGTFQDGSNWSVSIQPYTEGTGIDQQRNHPLFDVQVLVGKTLDRSGSIGLRTILRGV